MSYTSGNAGGTTWGAKTFNQIFAPNSETVGATDYWDKSQVEDYDTVVCSTNSTVLTAKYMNRGQSDSEQVLHWFGTGIYLCESISSTTLEMGDYVITPLSGDSIGASVRPMIRLSGSTAGSSRQRAYGVVLVPGGIRQFVTVATLGNWPVKRTGTATSVLNDCAFADNSNAGQVALSSGGLEGAMGKLYSTGFDIITSSAVAPTTENGAVLTMWGRTETF